MQTIEITIPKNQYSNVIADLTECSQSVISLYLKDVELRERLKTACSCSIQQTAALHAILYQGRAGRASQSLTGNARKFQKNYMRSENKLMERLDNLLYLKAVELITIPGINGGDIGRQWFLWPAAHSAEKHIRQTIDWYSSEEQIHDHITGHAQINHQEAQQQIGGI